MPAATNLGSYSDKSNFFNKPASVCGCLAPPPPTLPPKMPQLAGPPSSPQEMSNIMGRDRCDRCVLRPQKTLLFSRRLRDAAPILSVPVGEADPHDKAARTQSSRVRSIASPGSGGRDCVSRAKPVPTEMSGLQQAVRLASICV